MSGLGSFAEGFFRGQGLADERKRRDQDDALKAEDREIRRQETDLRMKDLGLSVQGREQEVAEKAKARAMADYEIGMKRRLAPMIAGPQKNHQAALSEIQRAFNEDPAFDDGTLIELETDESGVPVIGKDGTVGMSVKDKATGRVLGQNRVPVEGDDGIFMSTFNRLRDPIGYEKEAKAAAEKARERAQKIEDEARQHEQKKELYGIKKAGMAARGGGSRPAILQIADTYAEANGVGMDVALRWATDGKSLSESALIARILPNLLKSRQYAGDPDAAVIAAKEMARGIRNEPESNRPVVDGVKPKSSAKKDPEASIRETLGLL